MAHNPTILTRNQKVLQANICRRLTTDNPHGENLNDTEIGMIHRCLQIPFVAIGMNEKLYPCIQQIENGEMMKMQARSY